MKRPETSVTSVRLSNRPAGISVTFLQPLNAEASEAIFGQLSKKPSGMDVNDEQPEKSEAAEVNSVHWSIKPTGTAVSSVQL